MENKHPKWTIRLTKRFGMNIHTKVEKWDFNLSMTSNFVDILTITTKSKNSVEWILMNYSFSKKNVLRK